MKQSSTRTAAPIDTVIAKRESHPQRNVISNREAYLTELARMLARDVFAPVGYTVPTNVRFACSWPSRGGIAPIRRVIGQAWSDECAADGHFGIMISQSVDDPMTVASILAHELVHVTVGLECGHRGAFRTCALAIGLEGKMTATVAGKAFKRAVAPILERLGPYPHGALGPVYRKDSEPTSTLPMPQKGRMRRAQCEECGLIFRLAKQWIEGKSLGCPDMNCGGHEYQLHIV